MLPYNCKENNTNKSIQNSGTNDGSPFKRIGRSPFVSINSFTGKNIFVKVGSNSMAVSNVLAGKPWPVVNQKQANNMDSNSHSINNPPIVSGQN